MTSRANVDDDAMAPDDPALPRAAPSRLHGYEDVVMFKVATWCPGLLPAPSEADGRVVVVLHLQLPGRGSVLLRNQDDPPAAVGSSVAEAGERVSFHVRPPRDGIQAGTKYRCSAAQVTGVQFVGEPGAVAEAVVGFQAGLGHVVSLYSVLADRERQEERERRDDGGAGPPLPPPFCYRLGKLHVVPGVARRMVPGCGQGIHCFKTAEDCLDFASEFWTDFRKPGGHAAFPTIVSRCLTEPPSLVVVAEPQAEPGAFSSALTSFPGLCFTVPPGAVYAGADRAQYRFVLESLETTEEDRAAAKKE